MGKEIARNLNIGITGNTKLTLKCMRAIKELVNIRYVHGLPDHKLENKVNSVNLDSFCAENDIVLDKSDDWSSLLFQDLDLVISLGDSRIVPPSVLTKHKVIGNHGALLPAVQGGASLVWGRMLNTGKWGVTIFELEEKVDAGDILVLKPFEYDTGGTMEEFVDLADDKTVEALLDFLSGNLCRTPNSRWDVRVAKHVDSIKGEKSLSQALAAGINIYMPPRTPSDGIVEKHWNDDFVRRFKMANSLPYPDWSEK